MSRIVFRIGTTQIHQHFSGSMVLVRRLIPWYWEREPTYDISGIWKNNSRVILAIYSLRDVHILNSIGLRSLTIWRCALAYFYCNYKEDQRRDPATILRSLVKQLCLSGSDFPTSVSCSYKQRMKDGDLARLLNVTESRNLVIELSSGFLRTTIVVEALDESDSCTR